MDFQLLTKLDPLKGQIISVLAKKPCSTEELQKALKDKVPTSTLYRSVSELIEKDLVLRHKKVLMLNMMYTDNLADDLRSMRQNYREHIDMYLDFEKQKRVEIEAQSLEKLDPIWSHIENSLINMAEDKTWYEYNSHAYYFLSEMKDEMDYYQYISKKGISGFLALGQDTPLDIWASEKLNNTPLWTTKNCPNDKFPHEGYCVTVCAPYIIQLFLSPEIYEYYQMLFAQFNTPDENTKQLFNQGLHIRGKCKLVIEKNPKLAQELSSKIMGLFDA